jgi:hypothetical protein
VHAIRPECGRARVGAEPGRVPPRVGSAVPAVNPPRHRQLTAAACAHGEVSEGEGGGAAAAAAAAATTAALVGGESVTGGGKDSGGGRWYWRGSERPAGRGARRPAALPSESLAP